MEDYHDQRRNDCQGKGGKVPRGNCRIRKVNGIAIGEEAAKTLFESLKTGEVSDATFTEAVGGCGEKSIEDKLEPVYCDNCHTRMVLEEYPRACGTNTMCKYVCTTCESKKTVFVPLIR